MVLNLQTVTADILNWSERFVEQPHPVLGGWPPCPYARQARLSNRVQVLLGSDPWFDLRLRARWGMYHWDVIAYVYDPAEWPYSRFHSAIESANQDLLCAKDMLALEDHPDAEENVRGVIMNQGQYAIVFVQSLSKLNAAAQQLAAKDFYKDWPEQYLTDLFHHRQDPR